MSKNKIKIAFNTLGCRLNQYDTEAMKESLPKNLEIEILPWESESDIYIINSCTVTGKADQRCRQLARSLKRKYHNSKVVVTGCYAQTQSAKLNDIPEIDGIFGISNREQISDWLPRIIKSNQKILEVDHFPKKMQYSNTSLSHFDGKTRAFIKIQDGCNLRCSYCLIWKARGPARSRKLSDIIEEIQAFQEKGFVELVITGVNIGNYGQDLPAKKSLANLLKSILHRFPNLRFRLSSIHPNELSEDIIAIFQSYNNIQPYVHLSLQSLSDSVLDRMKRPYKKKHAIRAIANLTKYVPNICIGADIITGFPEETDEEFQETYDALNSLPINYLHVFRFSSRPGTAAETMKKVHDKTITNRAKLLRELSISSKQKFEQRLLNTWHEAIVESTEILNNFYVATAANYATVSVPKKWNPGSVVMIKIGPIKDGYLSALKVQQVENLGEQK